jgi:hypothetical protein
MMPLWQRYFLYFLKSDQADPRPRLAGRPTSLQHRGHVRGGKRDEANSGYDS